MNKLQEQIYKKILQSHDGLHDPWEKDLSKTISEFILEIADKSFDAGMLRAKYIYMLSEKNPFKDKEQYLSELSAEDILKDLYCNRWNLGAWVTFKESEPDFKHLIERAMEEYAQQRVSELEKVIRDKEEESEKPDFSEWLETDNGKKCNNFENIEEQKYLTNRLSWAFDAGRDRMWQQYLNEKEKAAELEQSNKELVEALDKKNDTFEAAPKKKIPIKDRLNKIAEKIRNYHSTRVEETDLMDAYDLGNEERSSTRMLLRELWFRVKTKQEVSEEFLTTIEKFLHDTRLKRSDTN